MTPSNNGVSAKQWRFLTDQRTISYRCCQPDWRYASKVSHEINHIAPTAGFTEAV
jgi:hypothetical protein